MPGVVIHEGQYAELCQAPKPYHTDHSIVYSYQYHVIFCPTCRREVLTNQVAARMKELVLAKQADDQRFRGCLPLGAEAHRLERWE